MMRSFVRVDGSFLFTASVSFLFFFNVYVGSVKTVRWCTRGKTIIEPNTILNKTHLLSRHEKEIRNMLSETAARKRSILISFDEGGEKSDLEFAKRLADLRARFPQWHVQGIIHDNDLHFIPRKPGEAGGDPSPPTKNTKPLKKGVGSSCVIKEFLTGLPSAAQPLTDSNRDIRGVGDDIDVIASSSSSSVESAGNRVGEKPLRVCKGMRLKKVVNPKEGETGVVVKVKSAHSFQLEFTDGARWWCGVDDVVFDSLPVATTKIPPTRGDGDPSDEGMMMSTPTAAAALAGASGEPVSLSTMARCTTLESELAATQRLVRKLMPHLGGGMADQLGEEERLLLRKIILQ